MKGKNCLISLNILHFSPNLQSDEGLQKFQTNNMIAKKYSSLDATTIGRRCSESGETCQVGPAQWRAEEVNPDQLGTNRFFSFSFFFFIFECLYLTLADQLRTNFVCPFSDWSVCAGRKRDGEVL